MVLITHYRLEEQGGFFYVITMETSYCPICQEMLIRRGTRQRVLFKSEEEKQILVIRRLYPVINTCNPKTNVL